MKKIVAVNIAFRDERMYKRWRLFANEYNVDVTLIGPKTYSYSGFGKVQVTVPDPIDEKNFRVRHVNMESKKHLGNDWFSWEYIKILKEVKPDMVYLVGYEIRNVVFMTALARKLFFPKAMIGSFTMRGIDMPLHGRAFSLRWKKAMKIFDFVNVHYPHGLDIIKNQGGYKGPVQMQTQIGVDKDIHYPNPAKGKNIRDKYGIKEDEFVFSSAIRFQDKKGVFETIEACRMIDKPYKYLLMGNGDDFDKVKGLVAKYNLEDNVILTDYVNNGSDVADHLNASNCFIHIPKTTKKWVDTFPVAVVQAMACRLPIIGSDSGAVPYQLGDSGYIIPEGNAQALADAMNYVLDNKGLAAEKGRELYERVLNSFEIRHLNKCLYQTIQAFENNEKDKIIFDQVNAFQKK